MDPQSLQNKENLDLLNQLTTKLNHPKVFILTNFYVINSLLSMLHFYIP